MSIKDSVFPFGPYEGRTIEDVCNENIKYARWAMNNIEHYTPDHQDYDEGIDAFLGSLVDYYNETFNGQFKLHNPISPEV